MANMVCGVSSSMAAMLVLAIVLSGAWVEGSECDCDYHRGGCVISAPAPRGFKCKCTYKGFWTCSGTAFPCSDDEFCPGGRASYCACVLGGGDCGAYSDKSRHNSHCTFENANRPATINTPGKEPMRAHCDCEYHRGGCIISSPAPEGYKCVCRYRGAWTCGGWPEGCSPGEYCPGEEYDYCGCRRGSGDCGAYPEHGSGDRCDFSKPAARTCNCNRNSDWTKGQYTILGVEFRTEDIVRTNPKAVAVGEALDIPNASDVEQSQTFTATKMFTTTSKFEHTHGIALSLGASFTANVPFLGGPGVSLTTSHSFTWGETNSISDRYSHTFTCNGPPKQHVRCQAFVTSFDAEIPYTIVLEHKTIPRCMCTSNGIWKGVGSYNSQLTAQKISDCNKINYLGVCTTLR